MDERDVDYLEHLEIPVIETVEESPALEGIIRAKIHEAGGDYVDLYRNIKGYFLAAESKRLYIEEICNDLINWLKDKKVEHRDLDLDMGTFKTWMKTSEYYRWRFYFLLDNSTWNKIQSDLKAGKISDLEVIYDLDWKTRKNATQELDSIMNIEGLIKVVETYKERSNKFFELILKRKMKIKSAPFQIILLGSADLRSTVKKIVNLAI